MPRQNINTSDTPNTWRIKDNEMFTEVYDALDAGGDVPSTRQINTTSPITGGGSLAADRTIAHANSTVTPGSYTAADITVDAKGHITAAASGSGGGSSATWNPVRAATTANITLSGTQTIDGVACVAGDRVLVMNQSTATQNGIYVVASGAWSRATDADASADFLYGKMVYIGNEGNYNFNQIGIFNSFASPFVLDTDAVNFILAIATATEDQWGTARAATQTEVDAGDTTGTDYYVRPETLAAYTGVTDKLPTTDYQARDRKDSVRVATTGNVSLSGVLNIDGVTSMTAGDRVLVKSQTTASQNGIYIYSSSGAWSRATDADTSAKVTPQHTVRVEQGTANGNKEFYCSNTGTITLGTTALTYAETGGAGGYATVQDEGSGLTQRSTVNFTGAGVTATDNSGSTRTDVTIPGKHVVQEEGTPLTARANLDFQGAGVTVTDNSGSDKTIVTIPSGGTPGADGIDAFSTTNGSFTQPAANSTVSVNLDTTDTATPTAWMGVDQYVYVVGGGYYQVDSVTDGDTVVLENLGYPGNAAVAATVSTAAKVSPAGLRGATGATGGSGHTIQDEGSSLTARTNLNFVGSGVTVTDDSANDQTDVTISGGSFSVASPEYFDDFMSGLGSTGALGALGWAHAGGSTPTGQAAEQNHPGIVRRDTATSSGAVAYIQLAATTSSVGSVNPADTFDVTWLLRLNTNDSNTTLRAGLSSTASVNPQADGVYMEKLAADTQWFGVTRASASQTRTAALASTSTAWVKLRVRRVDASTVGFTVDGGTEVTATATIPTAALLPFVQIVNTAAASKTVDIDYFYMKLTGLSR